MCNTPCKTCHMGKVLRMLKHTIASCRCMTSCRLLACAAVSHIVSHATGLTCSQGVVKAKGVAYRQDLLSNAHFPRLSYLHGL